MSTSLKSVYDRVISLFSSRHLEQLKCLFLQNNKIEVIENLDKLSNLTTLNLANNCIVKLETLSLLPNLHTLDVSKNKLKVGVDGFE